MMPETDGVEIDDPDNFTTSTRLQQIFEARRELRQIRREASSYRRSGASTQKQEQAIQYYRSGVESYLLEVDTLLRQHDPGPNLWNNKHYGTVVIRPPGQFKRVRGSYVAEEMKYNNSPLRVESIPEPKEIDVVGLKWLFETEGPVPVRFEFPITNSNDTYSAVETGSVSWTTLNQMVSDVNSFLGELGIGLDVDDTEEWKI